MRPRRSPLAGLRVALAATALLLIGAFAQAGAGAGEAAGARAGALTGVSAAMPPIRHVFVIVLENESEASSFGTASKAPYLARTLTSEGALLANYYATGHESNDNYIAMTSGQPPNVENQADCPAFANFLTTATGAFGAQEGLGCVYPREIQNIGTQLDARGLTWRDYDQDMGADPSREAGECGHPPIGSLDDTQKATAQDMYATRHNPFVYYHSIIDETTLCDSHVVNLDLLPNDLRSAQSTPNYLYIVPDLCDDGHDSPCADGEPGGLTSANRFLEEWVPRITGSPAFRADNGLLIITFDEASTTDAGSCCGEIAGPGSPLPGILGSGGGKVGAVLLSPCIAPGTVSFQPYNHYAMLRSVEDIFGLAHLGYAQLPGERSFANDVFTRRCDVLPAARIRAPALASDQAARPRVIVHLSARRAAAYAYDVEARERSPRRTGWRTLATARSNPALAFAGRPGARYELRARALGGAGAGGWRTTTVAFPTGRSPRGARYAGAWRAVRAHGAWLGREMLARTPGPSLTLRYRGTRLELIGARGPHAGTVRVSLDGHARTISLRARRARRRAVVLALRAHPGRHLLRLTVLRGPVAIEGFAVS